MKNLNIEKLKELVEKGKLKAVALGLTGAIALSMVGCSKPKEQPITEEPQIVTEEPVIDEPQEEIIDPNAPVFDIQNEEIFNQKVDELYEKLEGATFYEEDTQRTFSITSRDQIRLMLSVLNVECLSTKQLEFLKDYIDNNLEASAEFSHVIYIAVNYNLHNGMNRFYFIDYVDSDTEVAEYVVKIESIISKYINNEDLSVEEKQFLLSSVQEYILDLDREMGNSVKNAYCYCVCRALDNACYIDNGHYYDQLDDFFGYLDTLPSGYGRRLSTELTDDIQKVLSVNE